MCTEKTRRKKEGRKSICKRRRVFKSSDNDMVSWQSGLNPGRVCCQESIGLTNVPLSTVPTSSKDSNVVIGLQYAGFYISAESNQDIPKS